MSLLDVDQNWKITYRWVSAAVGEHYIKYYDDFYVSATGIAFLVFIFSAILYLPLRLFRGCGWVDCYRRKQGCYIPKARTHIRCLCRFNNRIYRCVEIVLGITTMIAWNITILMNSIFGKIPFYITMIGMAASWSIAWFHFVRVRDVAGVKKNKYGEKLAARFGIYFDDDRDEDEGDTELSEIGADDKKNSKKLSAKVDEDEPVRSNKLGTFITGSVTHLFWNIIYYYPWALLYGIWKRWWLIIPGVLILSVISIFLSVFTANMCISFAPLASTSSVSRRTLGSYCTWNTLCFHYLTVADDMSQNIIVNYHTYSTSLTASQVLYSTSQFDPRTVKTQDVKFVSGECFRVSNIWDEERYQCAGYLSNLQPNSTYYYSVRVSLNGVSDPVNTILFKFRTASADSSQPVKMVAGGNLPWALASSTVIAKYAATQEPLLAIINGNMGFDNGCNFCYRKWDVFFLNWQSTMITPLGYSIPLLTVPGNHDAGGFKRAKSDSQFYMQYFPHYMGAQTEMTINNRRTYHDHKVSAHTSIVTLDSWVHSAPSDNDQVAKLSMFFSNNQAVKNKIAVYHAGMYPCRTAATFMDDITKSMRDAWLPLFDKEGLTMAVEGHYGCYKVTKHLIAGVPVSDVSATKGTIYIGDGSMGISPVISASRPEFAEHGAFDNVFIITTSLSGTTIVPVVYENNAMKEKSAHYN